MREILKSFMNEPWWLISTSMSKFLTKELEKELLLNHILYEKEAVTKWLEEEIMMMLFF